MPQLLDFDNCAGRVFPCPYCQFTHNEYYTCVNATDFGAAEYHGQDMVNHPHHYNKGKYETIDIIEDADLGYHLSAALKYILRCKYKDNELQDISKAVWYLERYLKLRQSHE